MDPTILLVGLAALLLLSRQQQSGARTSSVIDEEREPEKPKDEGDSFLRDVTQLVRELGGLAGQFSSDEDTDRNVYGVYFRTRSDVPSLDIRAGDLLDKTAYTADQWAIIQASGDIYPVVNE
jgi:hypothetical protein